MYDIRVGNGYDVHALAEGLPLVLGGITIEHTKGCVAHSDGDVIVHALCDALLGAAALGDIGKHFPDTDMKYKGIDSMILLSRTVDLLRQNRYRILNVDLTLVLQSPKIGRYVDLMRQRIAEVSGMETGRVGLKATTTEHLGFTGREEGVAAYAVVLISE